MELASDASSRQASGILTPASDASLNADDSFNSISKKRKREADSMGDLLKESFVVRPYPATVFHKPRTLQPLMLLPRSALPLSTLDTGFISDVLPQSRLFETHVKILELEQRLGSRSMIVVARLDDGKTCYAVEREDRGLYALCRLGSWVDLSRLRNTAVASRDVSFRSEEKKPANSAFQLHTNSEFMTPEITISKKKRLAIEAMQSLIKRPVQDSTPIEQKPSLPTPVQSTPIQEAPIKADTITYTQEDVPNEVQPTAQDITNTLRTQYFDALYLSKTSLAFFAKGPLSRARAAFHLDYDSNLEMDDLVAFLESLVLSTSAMDKKYKDGIPELVKTLGVVSDDESSKPPRASRSKKFKPGKNGLYPNEDINIRKWWYNKDQNEQMGIDDTGDAISKRRISQLRLRETQLQMIILLEILALQPQLSKLKQEESLPQSNLLSSPDAKIEKRRKPKKPAELNGLIDLHIDRLCIWESVTIDSKPSEPQAHTKPESNPLRDFCVEVLLPFFSARLPSAIDSINRKLGGPTSTPLRSKLPKSSTASGTSTGSPLRSGPSRRPTTKPRRSLQRVLTDERSSRPPSRGPSGAISLMRSATAPTLPSLKREASEPVSLSSIPAATDLRANRGGVLKSKRFSQREVDLSAATEAKAKKAAAVEEQLRDAISALKRPNRSLAGRNVVETAERRVAQVGIGAAGSATASAGVRKKKPAAAVQILATPKGNRYRDVDPFVSRRDDAREVGIPASVERPPLFSVTSAPVMTFPDVEMNAGVEETPCKTVVSTPIRSASLNVPRADDPIASPLFSRRPPPSLHPDSMVVPNSVTKTPADRSEVHVLETPSKPMPKASASRALAEVSLGGNGNVEAPTMAPKMLGMGEANQDENRDVYQVLGWDDDYDF